MVAPRPTALVVFSALYALALVAVLTAPVGPSREGPRTYLGDVSRTAKRLSADTAVNVALFLPLGWSLRRALGRPVRPLMPVIAVAVVCGLFSLSMETVQYFLRTRYSSILDVLTNTLGALGGAWLGRRPG